MELVLRFDYGRTVPWVTRLADGTLRAIAGPDMVMLHTPVPMRGEDLTTVGGVRGRRGETVPFVLTHGPSHQPPPDAIDPEAALEADRAFWRDWAARSESHGEWDEAVMRSLITLKALTYAPTGGIVAAPTTSLPELLGGTRNWDYRYCWLRDATLTLLALMNAGYYDEARAWRDWLLRAAAGAPSQLQIMYGLAGERRLTEFEVPWLPGYEGFAAGAHRQRRARAAAARRVRRGDGCPVPGAARRARLDAKPTGRSSARCSSTSRRCGSSRIEGIWEVRGEPRHFTYSKVMAWVAFDRGVRGGGELRLRRTGRALARAAARRSTHEVCERGFDRAARQLRAVVRLEGARRQPAAAADGGLPAAGRPARARHDRGRRAPVVRRWISAPLRHAHQPTTACRPARARSWRAASGWPTPTC